jgi:hypothetical protein
VAEDTRRASALAADPKENAEHIMLVDLARNDLGRHAVNVEVKKFKEVHFYSHVIHLVSNVHGELPRDANPVQIFGDTFPAGTLSGAPKYKAIELIKHYENQNRSFYGGSLGYIGFNGEINQAIVIRSFLSLDNTLYYQAGAGIVAASDEASELQEVNNKLNALKKYDWPGNIRELENVIEHMFVMETSNLLSLASLPDSVLKTIGCSIPEAHDEVALRVSAQNEDYGDSSDEDLTDEDLLESPVAMSSEGLDFNAQKEAFEKEFIIKALKTFKGRINQTALHANIPKKTLLRKIEKYGINARDFVI